MLYDSVGVVHRHTVIHKEGIHKGGSLIELVCSKLDCLGVVTPKVQNPVAKLLSKA